MKSEWHVALLFLWIHSAAHSAPAEPGLPDRMMFDFENEAELTAWFPLQLPKRQQEPPVAFAPSGQNATSGKRSLKITFAGGEWPTLATTNIPQDWAGYETFKADVTVDRPCLVGFLAMQEKSSRERSWEGTVGRWVKTALLRPGRNEISEPLHPPNDYAISTRYGRIVSFEIFMYQPRPHESIYVDNIRLSARKDKTPATVTQFSVAGTGLTVTSVRELDDKLKAQWKSPERKTLDQAEAEFHEGFAQIKNEHPTVVLSVFREGEKGFDSRNPERVYAGWKDAYFSSHGPDGMTAERAENFGRAETQEIFMRHRCPLMRVDLSAIPTGSTIHAAKLIVVRATTDSIATGSNTNATRINTQKRSSGAKWAGVTTAGIRTFFRFTSRTDRGRAA